MPRKKRTTRRYNTPHPRSRVTQRESWLKKGELACHYQEWPQFITSITKQVAATERPHKIPWLLYAQHFLEQGATILDIPSGKPRDPDKSKERLIKDVVLSDKKPRFIPNAFFSLSWDPKYHAISVRTTPIWNACQEAHATLMAPECTTVLSTLLAHEIIHAIIGNSPYNEPIKAFTKELRRQPRVMQDYVHPKDKIIEYPLNSKTPAHRLVQLKGETYPFKLEEIDPRIVQNTFAHLLHPYFQNGPIWQRYWNIVQTDNSRLKPLARIKLQQTRVLLGRPNLSFTDIMPYYDMFLHNPEELKNRIKKAAPYFFTAAAHVLQALRLRM